MYTASNQAVDCEASANLEIGREVGGDATLINMGSGEIGRSIRLPCYTTGSKLSL